MSSYQATGATADNASINITKKKKEKLCFTLVSSNNQSTTKMVGLLISLYTSSHNIFFIFKCLCLGGYHLSFWCLIFLAVKGGAKYIPGATAIVEKFDRPGMAYATDNEAHAEWCIFDANVKGPSAGTEAKTESYSARAFATAELASASATVGPAKATVGLSADTGVEIGPTQLEAKVLGTGISLGRKVGISLFGTGFEFELW